MNGLIVGRVSEPASKPVQTVAVMTKQIGQLFARPLGLSDQYSQAEPARTDFSLVV